MLQPASDPRAGSPLGGERLMGRPSRHHIERAAAALRRAAADAGVDLPVAYSQTVAVDGLAREAELGVTRLGAGVVIHTQPDSHTRLPIVVGYADGRGQWYRDGRRHTQPAAEASPQAPEPARGVAL
jgi:hypothetical protein